MVIHSVLQCSAVSRGFQTNPLIGRF